MISHHRENTAWRIKWSQGNEQS